MRVTTSKLICDKCGKTLPEYPALFNQEKHYNMTIYYKSFIWGISCKKVNLCKKCAKEYFEAVKPFLNQAKPDDLEQEYAVEN